MTSNMPECVLSAHYTASVIEKAAEGICCFCLSKRPPHVVFTLWNARMASLTGYTIGDINALGWINSLYSDEGRRRKAYKKLAKLREGHGAVGEELEVVTRAGDRKILAVSYSAFQCGSGRRNIVAVMRDITARKRLEQNLLIQARIDYLTGSLTRRAIIRSLEKEVCRLNRRGGDLSVVLLDVDHFKLVNDTFGHAVGDETLRVLGGLVGSSLRAYDEVGRYGGEEFLVILPDTRLHAAREAAERIRGMAAAHRFSAGVRNYSVTVSAGVASFERGESVDSLIRRVDARLYEAKSTGRDRVCC